MSRRFILSLVVWAAAISLGWGAGPPTEPILMLETGGHTGPVGDVVFTPDGKQLVSNAADGTIRVWDVASGSPIRTIRMPVTRYASNENNLTPPYNLAVLRDGKTLLATKGVFLYRIALDSGSFVTTDLKDEIAKLAVSTDGTLLATLHYTKRDVRLWDTNNWTVRRSMDVSSFGEYPSGVAFSPDGTRLLVSGQTYGDKEHAEAAVFSVAAGKVLVSLKPTEEKERIGSLDMNRIGWSSEGGTLVAGDLWGADAKQSLGLHFSYGKSCVFTTNPSCLVLVNGRHRLEHINLKDHGERERDVDGLDRKQSQLALSPDGKSIAAGAGNDIVLLRSSDGQLIRRFTGQHRHVRAVGWSADASVIAWGTTTSDPEGNPVNPLERAFDWKTLTLSEKPNPISYRRWITDSGDWSLRREDTSLPPDEVTKKRDPDWKIVLRHKNWRRDKCSYAAERGKQASLLAEDREIAFRDGGLWLSRLRSQYQTQQSDYITSWKLGTKVGAMAPDPASRFILASWDTGILHLLDPTPLKDGKPRTLPVVSLYVQGNDWIAWTPEGYYAASPGGERLIGWHVNTSWDQPPSFYPAEKFRKTFYRPDVIQRLLAAGSLEKALALADAERGKKTEATTVSKVLPPTVAITSPKAGSRLDRAALTVEATANSTGNHPVTAMRLLLNGRPAALKRVDDPKDGEVKQSWTVELQLGRNRLQVLADSAVSQGNSSEVEILYAGGSATPEVEARLYVLAIGVAAYQNDGVPKLNYAAKDAKAVAEAFRTHGRTLYRSVEVKTFTDAEATPRSVRQGLSWLRKEATQKDVCVFYFSGHGQKDGDGRYYFLPVDVDPDDLLSTAVPGDDVMKALQGTPGRVLMILDACHAGAAGGDKRKAVLSDDIIRDLATDDYGVVTMSSSMSREFSLESHANRQGFFTMALIEGLGGKAGLTDGAVYLHKLDAYVTDRMKVLTDGKQHPVTAKPSSVRSFPLTKP